MSTARPVQRRRTIAGTVLLLAATLAGCSLWHHAPQITEPVTLISVLPIAPAASPEAAVPVDAPQPQARAGLAPGAAQVVTAQIYDVLSSSPKWRFVPDLTASQALNKLPKTGDEIERARALGTAVNADAVLCGTVSRYLDRVGTEFGARTPASVSFSLQLVSVKTGTVLWKGSFDETQKPLSSNLFNWWQFWRGGPKWFSAERFTRLGVEHLLDDLARQLGY